MVDGKLYSLHTFLSKNLKEGLKIYIFSLQSLRSLEIGQKGVTQCWSAFSKYIFIADISPWVTEQLRIATTKPVFAETNIKFARVYFGHSYSEHSLGKGITFNTYRLRTNAIYSYTLLLSFSSLLSDSHRSARVDDIPWFMTVYTYIYNIQQLLKVEYA